MAMGGPSPRPPPMNDTEPHQRARAAAIRFLSYGPRSEAEVRSRLRRTYPSQIVDHVLKDLRERDLVDDTRFARMWTDSRNSHKPRSAWAVKQELIARGVDEALAADAVQDIDDEETAYRAALSPARRLQGVDFRTFHRRLWAYLRRRGFSDSVCRRTLDRLWNDTEIHTQPHH